MNYEVYFEIYGKKMKVTINANSEHDAKHLIMGKIVFHKIVKKTETTFKDFDFFKDIFNLK